jgi:hypothetical protein
MKNEIKVMMFGGMPINNVPGYHFETFDPLMYFSKKERLSLYELIIWGINGSQCRRMLYSGASFIDKLYRDRNPSYMKLVSDFIERFSSFDLIVMGAYNFIHPEILKSKSLSKPIKVIGLVDDPFSSYQRGVPYLWAFDGVFYISPSYLEDKSMKDALHSWGVKDHCFLPLSTEKITKVEMKKDFFLDRKIDLAYVGYPSGSKIERLGILKKHFKNRFVVNGRWPLNGYYGFVMPFIKSGFYPHKVRSISEKEKIDLYSNLKIGFNMHLSDSPRETGNMRMYELPAYGVLQVCDKAGLGLHETIFRSDEVLYYDNLKEAIEIIEYYLRNDHERAAVAKKSYERFWGEYDYEIQLFKFLQWAMSLKNNEKLISER